MENKAKKGHVFVIALEGYEDMYFTDDNDNILVFDTLQQILDYCNINDVNEDDLVVFEIPTYEYEMSQKYKDVE